MSDKPADSGLESKEPAGLPTPSIVSETSGVEPNSTARVDADTIAAKVAAQLMPELEKRIERTFQSSKDRRFGDVDKISAYLKSNNGDVEKAVREMAIDQLLQDRAVPEKVAGDQGRSTATELQSWAEQQLLEAELPMDDPDIVAHFQRAQTADQFKTGLQKMVVKKLKQGKSVTAASVAGEGGRSPTPPGDKQEQLANLYAQLQATHKEPSKYADERKRIKADIAKLEAAP